MTILIGGKSRPSRRTHYVSWGGESTGISGTNIACFGKTETTGRGSLHFHVVLWGGISPDFLELMSDLPELCKQVGNVLDSMYSASIPKNHHAVDLTMKDLQVRCK